MDELGRRRNDHHAGLRQRSDELVCGRWFLAQSIWRVHVFHVECFHDQCACVVVVQLEQCVEPVVDMRCDCEFPYESDQLQVVVQRHCLPGQLVYELWFELAVGLVIVPHQSESGCCWIESVVPDWRCCV
jgi:hypothetical protein